MTQVIFGRDLVGYPLTNFRPSGFFGDEKIAGGYIQKFSLFFIFYVTFRYPTKKILIFILFTFFLTTIFLTLNRMPALIYLFSVIFIFLIEKKFKEILIFFVLFTSLIIGFLKYDSENANPESNKFVTRTSYMIKNFYYSASDVVFHLPELF